MERLLNARRLDREEFAQVLRVSLRTLDRRRITKEYPEPDEWDHGRPLWYDITVAEVLLKRQHRA